MPGVPILLASQSPGDAASDGRVIVDSGSVKRGLLDGRERECLNRWVSGTAERPTGGGEGSSD